MNPVGLKLFQELSNLCEISELLIDPKTGRISSDYVLTRTPTGRYTILKNKTSLSLVDFQKHSTHRLYLPVS